MCFRVESWWVFETFLMTPTIAQELLEKPGLLVSLQSVVSNFCDIDALLSLCVVIRGDAGSDGASRKRSHEDSIFNLEQRVNHIIGLKHALEVRFCADEIWKSASLPDQIMGDHCSE